MPVDIRGKQYKTVAERVAEFRDDQRYAGYRIITRLVSCDADRVIVEAAIQDYNGDVIATGHAEEDRSDGKVNEFSAVENCETSAVGRCLAFMGHAGGEIRSADEFSDALIKQTEKRLHEGFAKTTEAVEANHDSLVAIRQFLADDNFDAAREAWNEISHDDQAAIWRATTKGGWFSPRERQQMKWWSNDFERGRKE